MAKPTVVFPDAERLAVDAVTDLLATYEPNVGVGVVLPAEFTIGSPSYVQVALDGTPRTIPYVLARATIRIVAWSAMHADTTGTLGGPSEAKRLALLTQGLMLGWPGNNRLTAFTHLAGPWLSRDDRNRAYLCAFLVRATVRAEAL